MPTLFLRRTILGLLSVAAIILLPAVVADVFSTNVNRCVDANNGEYTCTDDVMGLRRQADGRSINVGVTQRVDGSDSEKKAIREVLNQMDEYFFNEVLALPEYENVRPQCKNTNELCAFWSGVGECESNRVFMLSNCAAACRFCLLLHSGLA